MFVRTFRHWRNRKRSKHHCCIVSLSALTFVLFIYYYVYLSASNWDNPTARGVGLSSAPHSEDSLIWDERAEHVKRAFLHAYSSYISYAYPHDELLPLSRDWQDNLGGWGVTVFDSLDTLHLMQLHDEFDNALFFVGNVTFSMMKNSTLSVFETTIRYLGGLLSAYALSRHPTLLRKAEELAEALSPAFDTPSGLPWANINTVTAYASGSYIGSLAEVASCQLEYAYLAHETRNLDYYVKAAKISSSLSRIVPSKMAMLPNRISIINGNPIDFSFSVGGGADSAHEYLLKYYLLTAQEDKTSLDIYMESMTHILTKMLYLSPKRSLLYVTDLDNNGQPSHVFEHLSCFLPGLLALGVHSLPPSSFFDAATKLHSHLTLLSSYSLSDLHMWAATGLGESCWAMYADQPTVLGPEEVLIDTLVSRVGVNAKNHSSELWIDGMERWRLDPGQGGPPPGTNYATGVNGTIKDYEVRKSQYYLRPETIESMYYLWKVTGDIRWRERGWAIFEALEKETKNEAGYATLRSVEESPATQMDEMPSFFLAETLKYLYLLFLNEDRIPLSKWVFNTEAHPLPIFSWTRWGKIAPSIAR